MRALCCSLLFSNRIFNAILSQSVLRCMVVDIRIFQMYERIIRLVHACQISVMGHSLSRFRFQQSKLHKSNMYVLSAVKYGSKCNAILLCGLFARLPRARMPCATSATCQMPELTPAAAGSTGYECFLCDGCWHGFCGFQDLLGDSELKHICTECPGSNTNERRRPEGGAACLVSSKPRDNAMAN